MVPEQHKVLSLVIDSLLGHVLLVSFKLIVNHKLRVFEGFKAYFLLIAFQILTDLGFELLE